MDIKYPATVSRDENGRFFVKFVDLEDTFTEGETREEALFNAAEALSAMLAWRLDEGLDIPVPSAPRHRRTRIAPDAKTQAALLIRRVRGERSLAELARALDTSWPSAQRLEDPRHWPSLRQLERAAAALGRRLVLSVE